MASAVALGAGLRGLPGWLETVPAAPESSGRVYHQTVVSAFSPDGSVWERIPRRMTLRKWNKVYVKTSARGGSVLLLVEKLKPGDAGDAAWTAVDNTGRVQALNMRNKAVYSLRPQRGIDYSPMSPLTKEQQRDTEAASWNLVRRAGEDGGNIPERLHPEPRRARGRYSHILREGPSAAPRGSGTWRTWGPSPSATAPSASGVPWSCSRSASPP